MFRKPHVLVLLAALLMPLHAATTALGCYAVVVGRAASADGSVLVGHNEENGGRRVLWFHKIPAQKHASGTRLALAAGGQVEQAPETAAMLWSQNPGIAYSDGYLNEHGVAIVSDGCPSREDDYDTLKARGDIRDGGIGYMLRRLVAQRAKTAIEGVELIGRLVERFGYAASGRTYVVADPNEAWLVAVVQGRRWVAQRVPDDRVVIQPNVYVIGEVDLADTKNFRGSPDLVSYAVSRGWFDPQAGRPFNFRAAYQRPDRLAPDPRQFRGQELVTGRPGVWPPAEPLPFCVAPSAKLTVADVVAILRNKTGLVPLFGKSTQESAVFQLRQDMPRAIGCIYWRTSCRPDISPLVPWYVGVTSTPAAYSPPADADTRLSLARQFDPPAGTFDPDPSLAWWRFKALAAQVDQDDAGRISRVKAACAALEQSAYAQQPQVEKEALRLWQTDPEKAREYLTRYCAEQAARGLAITTE